MKKTILFLSGILALVSSTQASLFFADDFTTFTSGNLVGQQGWSQFGAPSTSPLQVTSTGVLMPGGITSDGQDAIKHFGLVSAPLDGTISLYQGMSLKVGSVPLGKISYYFTVLQDVSAGFSNIRFVAQDQTANPGFYKLGARVTGQTGAPWFFGGDLAYGSQHLVIIEANMVAGAQNDFIRVFVDPAGTDLSLQTPYLTATVTVGGVENDPTGLGALLISQYGTLNQVSQEVEIGGVAVGDAFGDVAAVMGVVPEPSCSALLGIGLLAWGALRRR